MRCNASDSTRSAYLGPRIAGYIAIWEATDRRWRTVRDIAERAGHQDIEKSDIRQVRRVLLALNYAGLTEFRRSSTPNPDLWRRI